MKRLLRTLLLLPFLAAAAAGQFAGYSSPQSVTQTIFTAVTSCAASAPITNLGQTVHILTYKVANAAPSTLLVIRIEGSFDNSTYFPISDDGIDTVQGQVIGIGAYPYVRVNPATCAGFGGSINLSASYIGTSSTPGTPYGLYNPSQQVRKTVFSNANINATGLVSGSIQAPYGSAAGFIVLIGTNGAAFVNNSQVQVTATYGGTFGFTSTITTFTIKNTPSVQVVPVQATSTTSLTVTYNGGSSANTFSAFYYFFPPGAALPSTAQPPSNNNQEVTATNATASVVLNGAPLATVYVFSVNARCSAGTAQLTIVDNSQSKNLFTSAATEVGTTPSFRFQWNPGLASIAPGDSVNVNLSTCGVSNVGTLDVQASVF